MKYITLVTFSIFLTACATIVENPPQVERIERPAIGDVASAAIGETMVEKYVAVGQYGFKLSDPATATFSSIGIKSKAKIEAQAFVFTEQTDDGEKVYRGTGSYCIMQVLFGCQNQGTPRIIVPSDASKSAFLVQAFSRAPLDFRPPEEDSIVTVAAGSPSVKKEIIFTGRAGNTAKFLYREYNDDFARPAFSQELQYDLSEGTEVGFQELRINILETSNTGITYMVTNHFDWPK